MTPSDDLFRLIKSLSPSEKRYFKLFAEHQGTADEKSYMSLFNAMDESNDEDYDENKIRKKLKRPGVIKAFPQAKKYLYALILKSMRLYRSESSEMNRIIELMQDELFFTEKGLKEERKNALKTAKEIAVKFDRIHMLLALHEKEEQYIAEFEPHEADEFTEKRKSEELALIEKLRVEAELRYVFHKLWKYFISKRKIISPEIQQEIDNIKKNPLLQDYSQMATFKSKWTFLRIYTLLSALSSDIAASKIYYKQVIDLFEEYPHQKEERVANYKSALGNYLAACHRAKEYHVFKPVIAKLRSITTKTIEEEAEILSLCYFYEMVFFLNTAAFDEGLSLVDVIENFMKKFKRFVVENRRIGFYENISVLYFLTGKYEEALKYSEKIIAMKSEHRKDLLYISNLMELYIFYELGNWESLTYAIRNKERYMRKENIYAGFEKIIIKNLKKLIASRNKKETVEIFRLMEEELTRSKGNEKISFLEETLIWVRSHISGKNMADVLRSEIKEAQL